MACAGRVTPPVASRRGISMSYVAGQPRNQRVGTRSTKQQLEMYCCYGTVADESNIVLSCCLSLFQYSRYPANCLRRWDITNAQTTEEQLCLRESLTPACSLFTPHISHASSSSFEHHIYTNSITVWCRMWLYITLFTSLQRNRAYIPPMTQ